MRRIIFRTSILAALSIFLAGDLRAGGENLATIPCDTNGDGVRNISDATYLFDFLFLGGPPLVRYAGGGVFLFENGDCNGDEVRNISDGIGLLAFLFLDGDPPVSPFPPDDADTDGVRDEVDNCPLVANTDQLDDDGDTVGNACDICLTADDSIDSDGDTVPDGCDNCVDVFNPNQRDSNGNGVGNACDTTPTIFAGALATTRGRWTFRGSLGTSGAASLCAANFPGSTICTFNGLQGASAAGELAGITDLNGEIITSFWAHRPNQPDNRQCVHPDERVPWTYATGHLAVDGEFVTLNNDGTLGRIQTQRACQGRHSVGCCNP